MDFPVNQSSIGGQTYNFIKETLSPNILLIFLEDDDKFKLSPDFLSVLTSEIVIGTRVNPIIFVQIEYKEHPISIGKYLIHNSSGLDEGIEKIINYLQDQFEKSFPTTIRKLILICQMFLLKKSEYYQLKYFADEVFTRLIKDFNITDHTDEFLRDNVIIGNKEFEQKYEPQDIATFLYTKVETRMNRSNLAIVILGYDEKDFSKDPVPVQVFLSEKEEITKELKNLFRSNQKTHYPDLLLDFLVLNEGSLIWFFYSNEYSDSMRKILLSINKINLNYDEWTKDIKKELITYRV